MEITNAKPMNFRIEKDTRGEVKFPADKLVAVKFDNLIDQSAALSPLKSILTIVSLPL